jgi:hypothetical protein
LDFWLENKPSGNPSSGQLSGKNLSEIKFQTLHDSISNESALFRQRPRVSFSTWNQSYERELQRQRCKKNLQRHG